MREDDDALERRPARRAEDTRLGRAVADAVRELAMLFPDRHVCASYVEIPGVVIVRAVNRDDATTIAAERWITK
jgi:hypothetical protein